MELQAAAGNGVQHQLTINLGRPKHRVTDFSAWLDAGTLSTLVIVVHASERVAELLAYQHIILSAMQQFTTEDVLNYDGSQEHTNRTASPVRWYSVNHDLWSMKLMDFPRPS